MASPVPKPPLEIRHLDPDIESYLQRGWNKCKEQPFVPIGVVATCAALGAAFIEMKKGNSTRLNKFLRLRVVAQGATIAACVVGSYVYGGPAKEAKEEEKRQEREKMMDILASVGDGKPSTASVSQSVVEPPPKVEFVPPTQKPRFIVSKGGSSEDRWSEFWKRTNATPQGTGSMSPPGVLSAASSSLKPSEPVVNTNTTIVREEPGKIVVDTSVGGSETTSTLPTSGGWFSWFKSSEYHLDFTKETSRIQSHQNELRTVVPRLGFDIHYCPCCKTLVERGWSHASIFVYSSGRCRDHSFDLQARVGVWFGPNSPYNQSYRLDASVPQTAHRAELQAAIDAIEIASEISRREADPGDSIVTRYRSSSPTPSTSSSITAVSHASPYHRPSYRCIKLLTDSAFVHDVLNKGWSEMWESNAYRYVSGQVVPNCDLLQQLFRLKYAEERRLFCITSFKIRKTENHNAARLALRGSEGTW